MLSVLLRVRPPYAEAPLSRAPVATGIRASLVAARAHGVVPGVGTRARVVGPVVAAGGVLALAATSSVPAAAGALLLLGAGTAT